MRLDRLPRVFAVVAAAMALSPSASAKEGLSRNMLAAEAAVGREEYALAAQYFEAECTAGGALGCFNLAIFEQVGQTGLSNPAKAMTLSQRACDLGLADGCANVAALLVDDRGDFARAERLSAQACDRNSAHGCYVLSVIQDGRYGKPARPREAGQAVEKACRLGWGTACYQQGFNLAKQARDSAHWGQVADLYLAACDAGSADGCNGLGALAAEGRTGKPDGETAHTYFSLGCERRSALACRNLAALLSDGRLVPVDPTAAKRALERAGTLSQPLPVTVHPQGDPSQ